MLINTVTDPVFRFFKEYLLSADFPCKDIVVQQMENDSVDMEISDYCVVFTFSVDPTCARLPVKNRGILVCIQEKNQESLTMTELFVENQQILELRTYNITCDRLNWRELGKGTQFLDLYNEQEHPSQ